MIKYLHFLSHLHFDVVYLPPVVTLIICLLRHQSCCVLNITIIRLIGI